MKIIKSKLCNFFFGFDDRKNKYNFLLISCIVIHDGFPLQFFNILRKLHLYLIVCSSFWMPSLIYLINIIHKILKIHSNFRVNISIAASSFGLNLNNCWASSNSALEVLFFLSSNSLSVLALPSSSFLSPGWIMFSNLSSSSGEIIYYYLNKKKMENLKNVQTEFFSGAIWFGF